MRSPWPSPTYSWTLDAIAGTLAGATTATPSHTEPATAGVGAAGVGTLTLEAMVGTTVLDRDQKKVKIYKDHMERDFENWGIGIEHFAPWKFTNFNVVVSMPRFNCHGSTWHSYDGSGYGDIDGKFPLPGESGTPITTVQVTHNQFGLGTHPSLGTLQRGDVIIYFMANGKRMHSQTATGNGNETYGANNEPLTFPGMPRTATSIGNESFKWAVSEAGDWANKLYLPGLGVMPVTIKVFRP